MAHQGGHNWQGSTGNQQDHRRSSHGDNKRWDQKEGGNYQRPHSGRYQERPYSGGGWESASGRHKGRPMNRSAEEHDREPSPDRTGFDHFNDFGGKDDNREYGQSRQEWQSRGSHRGNRGYNRNGYDRGRGKRHHDSAEGFHGRSWDSTQNNESVDQFPVGQWGSGPGEAVNKPERNSYKRYNKQQHYSGQDQSYGRQDSSEKDSKQKRRMDEVQDTQEGPIWHLTKNLSYFLRHGHEKEGYTLMDDGYIYVDEVLKMPRFQQYSEEDIRHVTTLDPIGRFTIKEEEGTKRPMVKANFLNTRDTANPHIHLSKTLSYLLRHGAEKHGFILMPGGFLYVDQILKYEGLKKYTEDDVRYVVQTNSKQRFSIQEEAGTKRLMVRANQGHSVQVEGLDLKPILVVEEAPVVIHGTYYAAWEVIKQQGLSRMGRNHIHFAVGEPDDSGVISGMRKSAEVLIYMDLEKCLKDGLKFYRSSNDVILSDGNDEGFIYPCYFKMALSRKPRYMLEFDGSIAQKVTTIVGGEHLTTQESKKKKKKKKKKHSDRDEEMEEEDKNNVTENIQKLKVNDNNGVTGAASGAGNVSMETEEQTMEEVLEHIKFTDIEECQNAVSFLSTCKDPVAVWCFGNQLGEPNGTIGSIVCVTQKKAYFFDLTSGLDLIEEGELGNYFNSKDTSIKVFHGCAKVSYTLFHQCKIILDGTNVYDTAVAYDQAKAVGVGNLSELADFQFTPNKWSEVTEDMDGQVLERCKIILQAYEKFKNWFTKPPKKEIFEEVMSLLEKDDVKAAREKRKKELKQKQNSPKGKKGNR